MNMEKKPVKTKDIQWEKLGNNYLVVDPSTMKTHNLDPVSFMIWVQCDGNIEIEQLVDVFSVNGNRDVVKLAIKGILERLADSGLIKWI